MFKTILIVLAVVAAFYIAWVGGQAAYSNVMSDQTISPGDIVIAQVSNAKEDWITLHNNLNREADLRGFVFTDGDNIFTFPQGAIIPAGGDLRIAASKDEGKIDEPVDLYWGDWGLSEEGELVMLVNASGDMVMDFVFAQPLEEGEILERFPAGTGPLMTANKTQPMQMQRPSYRAVSTDSINGLGEDFSTSVVTIGGLLSGVATFLINMDQSREILGRFGFFGKKKKSR
ncbi:MAG: lamin tail domain-containing protein [Chloroflexota bacterium]